jgi:predicted phage-related endonuclease
MGIVYHYEIEQGTEEWYAVRCGLLTASEMKLIVTPAKFEYASNDKERAHLYELVAQRITNYVEPKFIGQDMLRGKLDEIEARLLYSEKYAPVQEVGFVTNDKWGFTLGASPDGIVGNDGFIECKSRAQKYQVQAIINDKMDDEFKIQVQALMLIMEREWCDFISYSGGLPMMTKRILPDAEIQAGIINAATKFHEKMNAAIDTYKQRLNSEMRLIPTERKIIDTEIV